MFGSRTIPESAPRKILPRICSACGPPVSHKPCRACRTLVAQRECVLHRPDIALEAGYRNRIEDPHTTCMYMYANSIMLSCMHACNVCNTSPVNKAMSWTSSIESQPERHGGCFNPSKPPSRPEVSAHTRVRVCIAGVPARARVHAGAATPSLRVRGSYTNLQSACMGGKMASLEPTGCCHHPHRSDQL